MTPTPPHPGTPAPERGRRGQDALWSWLRGLGVTRGARGRWLAGVASGTADRLGVDPVLVRAGFFLLAVFGGLGVPLYLVAWALLPDTAGSILAERAVRQGDRKSIVLVVVIAAVLLGSLGDRGWVWTLLPGVAVLAWYYRSRRGSRGDQGDPGPGAHVGADGRAVPPWSPPAGSAVGSPVVSYGDPVVSYGDPGAAAGGAPYGMGPGRTGAVVTPPAPVTRPQRRSAGLLGLLLTLGLGLAGAAVAAQVLHDLRAVGVLPAHLGPVPFVLGCALAGVGLALVLIGLLGRRAGFTGALAVLLTAAAVAATAVPAFVFSTGTDDMRWVASDPAPADGYRLGLGDGTLDLSGASPGQVFDVELGLGDLTVVVPAGVSATIDPQLGMGDLTLRRADGSITHPSSDQPVLVRTGDTVVTVHARLGAGDLAVREVAPAVPAPPSTTSAPPVRSVRPDRPDRKRTLT